MSCVERLRRLPGLIVVALIFFAGMRAAAAQSCVSLGDLGKFKNKFVCPVKGGAAVRSSDACAPNGGGTFKARRQGGKLHNALDMNAPEGTDVVASKPGKVAVAEPRFGDMGSTVIIDHEDGDYSVYGHLAVIKSRKGACVTAGELIGSVGYTGNAQCLKDNKLSSHLHFAIIRATKSGLADAGRPIEKAIKSSNDWLEIGKEFFPGDNLDLGIKDPQVILGNAKGCLH